MSLIDVLSVGDIVTDTYIRLPSDQAHTYANEDGKWLTVPFGAKIPYESADIKPAGGNAPNASVSFARLGLKSGLVTNVGDDQTGRDNITALRKEGVDSRYVHINHGKNTNSNFILWFKEDRTILTKHETYDYSWPHIHKNDLPKWVYFSSLSKNSLPFHDDLSDWLDTEKDIKLAFSPGTFQIAEGVVRLKRIFKRCDVLLLNREEASRVGGGDHDNIHDLLDKLHALGPNIVVITDGPKGTYASGPEGRLFMPIYPDPAPPLERSGAGDAFSSTFVASLIKGSSLEDALKWGPINSMNVVQHIGPHDGLLTESQLLTKLNNAPEWYHPNRL